MGLDQQAHRSGPLKQKNKTHKTGRHRSKGTIDNEQKGLLFCMHILRSNRINNKIRQFVFFFKLQFQAKYPLNRCFEKIKML